MKKRGTRKASKTIGSEKRGTKVRKNVRESDGRFEFHNGDVYDGGYKLYYDRLLFVKQGKGVYTTDNFDVYDAEWDDDAFTDNEVHIRYNNDARYRGKINSNGTMIGFGTYTFPDGSSIEADWLDNKPFSNIVYREPLGFEWIVENVSENVITFSPGNHFWHDMLSDQSTTHSTEPTDANELEQPSEKKNST